MPVSGGSPLSNCTNASNRPAEAAACERAS
jgi:hypothetical protein